jgi:hypothetical protein
MSQMNVDPITTLLDGSQLLVSTQFVGEGRFKCQLFVSKPSGMDKTDLRIVHGSEHEAPTCRQAQDNAYTYAMRLYPDIAGGMNKPPYLIWQGPLASNESAAPVEPHRRWHRYAR